MATATRILLCSVLTVVALVGGTSVAGAQDAGEPETGPQPPSFVGAADLPLAWAQRPLTLTEHTLRGDLRFGMRRFRIFRFDPMTGLTTTTHDVAVGLALGAGFGITDDLEVGAEALPFELSPSFEYRRPSVYGLFRFVSGPVDVGGLLRVVMPVEGDLTLYGGIPVLMHLSSAVRLDTGLFVDLTFADRADETDSPHLSFVLPIELAINATPEVFFGVGTTVFLADVTEDLGSGQQAGVFVGYTVPAAADAPLADLRIRFQFPTLVDYDPAEGEDALDTDVWELVFQANVYFDL